MNKLVYIASFIYFGLLIFSACADGPERDVEYGIYSTESSIHLLEGEEYQLTASPTTQTFTWETTDTSVATVSSTGLVRGISDGACFINITSSEGLKREIPVDVEKLRLLEGIDVFYKVNLAPVDEITLLLGQSTELATNALPADYNERVVYNVIWESSDEDIVTIDDVGKLTTVNIGTAEIIASIKDKPTVKEVIQVEVVENPITIIQVDSELDLMLNVNHTVTPVLLPPDYGVVDASLVWSSSDESVVKVDDGEIEPVGLGTAVVTVSLNSNPLVKSEITVNVANMVIEKFTDAGSNLVKGDVYLEKDKEIAIVGVNPTTFELAYNRDFMSYDAATGEITFIGETGNWEVFYSSKYNYFWVARMDDEAPDCYWVVGDGFACPPKWHSDFASGGQSTTNIRQMAYMRPIGNGKYQATISLNESFGFATYADRELGGKLDGYTLIAPTGIVMNPANDSDVMNAVGFVPGYYRFTFDKPNMTYTFEKVD